MCLQHGAGCRQASVCPALGRRRPGAGLQYRAVRFVDGPRMERRVDLIDRAGNMIFGRHGTAAARSFLQLRHPAPRDRSAQTAGLDAGRRAVGFRGEREAVAEAIETACDGAGVSGGCSNNQSLCKRNHTKAHGVRLVIVLPVERVQKAPRSIALTRRGAFLLATTIFNRPSLCTQALRDILMFQIFASRRGWSVPVALQDPCLAFQAMQSLKVLS